jgi:D-methionine transport system substrate-binding protein
MLRSPDDLSAALINTGYTIKAGLSPTRDAIAIEDAEGPFANLSAVRDLDRNESWVKKRLAAYESPDVKYFVDTQFKRSIIPAF